MEIASFAIAHGMCASAPCCPAGANSQERMGNALAQMAELQPMGTTLATTEIKTKAGAVEVAGCRGPQRC